MIASEARTKFSHVIELFNQNRVEDAQRILSNAVEDWPEQCDLHRALAVSMCQLEPRVFTPAEISAIRNSLSTYDELNVALMGPTAAETAFAGSWNLPLLPMPMLMKTRGQARAAFAAQLVEQGRYDDAVAELDAASREPVTVPANADLTAKEITAVRAVLFYRTQRWHDLLSAATELTASTASEADTTAASVRRMLTTVGHALGGAALAHLGSHGPAQEKLTYATNQEYTDISAWSALQLGLSYRTAGQEDAAQKAFATGMQFRALPELTQAATDRSIRMRVTTAAVIDARTSFWDPDTEPDVHDFQRTSSQEERSAILAEARAELEAMEGMDEVKEQMLALTATVMFENEMRRRGMPVTPKTRHMIFKGPPGTGKTTIANLIARLYYGLGILRLNNFVQIEQVRAQLTGTVEGQSAEKTLGKLNEARGGLIFFDEIYDLVQDRNGQADPYGTEAMTTILSYMENNRDDIVVVIAGYEDQVERFLGENPGLKGRFADSMTFATFTPDAMWNIFTGMARQKNREVDATIAERFKRVIEVMWDRDARGFRILDVAGNARFARTLLEKAEERSSMRLMLDSRPAAELTDAQFLELSAEDVLGAMAGLVKRYGLPHLDV